MEKEIKDMLLEIQSEIKKMNKKLECVAKVSGNGDYTYTSDPNVSHDRK